MATIILRNIAFIPPLANRTSTLLGAKLVSTSAGPRDVLLQKTRDGELLRDELQYEISQALQVVYENIKDYKPSNSNVFTKLFARKQKTPKGLYIYGAVGKLRKLLY